MLSQRKQKAFAIVCDSSSELSAEQCERMDVVLVSSRIYVRGQEQLDRHIDLDHFEDELTRQPKGMRVSAPGKGSFLVAFEELVEEGYTSLVVLLPGRRLNTAYEAALAAAHEVSNARIHVIDTAAFSVKLALLVAHAALDRALGKSATETAEHVKELVSAIKTSFIMPAANSANLNRLLGKKTGLRQSIANLSAKFSGMYVLVELDETGALKIVRRYPQPAFLARLLVRKMSLYSQEQGTLGYLCAFSGHDKKQALGIVHKPMDTNEFESEHICDIHLRPASLLLFGEGALAVAYVPKSVVDPQKLKDALKKDEV